MDFHEFSIFNRRRCESPKGFNHKLDSWSLSDWFMAVLGELGEAANIGKKLNRVRDGIIGNSETPDELKSNLRNEIADAFIYLDLLCQSQGFNLHDAVMEKFQITSKKIGYDDVMFRRSI
jgi:NTP pyrophosphatase (non-canonical NTP hydrolase)